jgi:hypothetical protein
MQVMMHVTMLVQTMQLTMLTQTMMQATGDGDVCDINDLFVLV